MKVDDFVAVMESFVGTTESPPGSNRTPIGEEYGWNGVSWCAETISVACNRLGFPLHEPSVIRIEAHARAGDWGMSWSSTPVRGAAACFDWKGHGNPADMHVGAVKDVLDGPRFHDIEGNYHDACQVVLRDMKFVRGFAIFPFEDAAPAPVPPAPAPPAPPTPPAPSSPYGDWPHQGKPLIRLWSRGDAVAYLQRVINDKANGILAVDGVLGPKTDSRVKDVQRNAHISVDGVVGPQTWGVIDHLATS